MSYDRLGGLNGHNLGSCESSATGGTVVVVGAAGMRPVSSMRSMVRTSFADTARARSQVPASMTQRYSTSSQRRK